METQLIRGKQHEKTLDKYFKKEWIIIALSLAQEKQGLGDRLFIHRDNSRKLLVEYKSDETASRTGNAFIETISVDTANKPGWVHTCQADYIMYYLPLDGLVYVLTPDTLRQNLPRWADSFPTRPTKPESNHGYQTHGVLVPLDEIERCADKVLSDIEAL